ncbi:uncharacterized protein B0P05DRAFT_67455 [Gilbertella persicaria]|uniref:uncharacterized protein n=1 Tax=Gilbertella persicaria TaxID=101096 RepID=UPI00221F5695|nr:uncharacterized protein B0P05DRAFT_67455 [Gilbertella persicaria]KAI8081965.1 hypothetical protein B0P05DRAFT_67455 [Gilbertella persicaria]
MSHGPPRAYSSHNYSAISPNTMARQQVMNSPQSFQQTVSDSPPTTLGQISSNKNTNNSASNSPGHSGGRITAGSTQETLYCDSCQTFRHISFFPERDYKYNVCNICRSREMQKRKQQMERFEMYEEQQRNIKQARYIQYNAPSPSSTNSSQQQIHSPTPINLNGNTNNSNNNSSSGNSSSNSAGANAGKCQPLLGCILITLVIGHIANNNNSKQSFTPPNNLSQMQPSLQSQTTTPLSLPSQQQQQSKRDGLLHRLEKSKTPDQNKIPSSSTIITTTSKRARESAPKTPLQIPLPLPRPHHKLTSTVAERATQNVISLEEFVRELGQETEFDRNHYHVDIRPLLESLGSNAGFTQLGRAVCERVLEGTKFNFR